jgi:hypothetical protein
MSSKVIIYTIILCIILIIIINHKYSIYPIINNYSYISFNSYINSNLIPSSNLNYPNIIFLYSHDYKILPQYFQYALHNLKKYCNLHNYNFIIKDHYPNTTISPYWLRVKDLIELSNKYPENSAIIIYLDLDTIINLKYKNLKLDKLLNIIDIYDNKNYDIYIGKDCKINKYINSGVLFIKNTKYSKELLNNWYKLYNPTNWKYNNHYWTCKTNFIPCIWAGYQYEQGALEYIYQNNLFNSKNHIKILHTSFCSSSNFYADSFIYHFMEISTQKRIQFMKKLT